MYFKFEKLVILIVLVSLTTTDQAVDLSLFMRNIHANLLGDRILFCGNFTNYHFTTKFLRSHQIATQSEEWLLSAHSSVNKTAVTLDGTTISIVFFPSSMTNFDRIYSKMLEFFKTNSDFASNWNNNQRMFFLVKPLQSNITTENYTRNNLEILHQMELSGSILPKNEHVYVVLVNEWTNVLEIAEIYGISPTTSMYNFVIDPVTKGTRSLTMTELMRISPRRNNFHLENLRVVALEGFEDEVKIVVRDNMVEFVDGASFKTLKDFEKTLNFTYTPMVGKGLIQEGKDNKSVTGVGLQVIKNESDFCITTTTIEEYRIHHLHFLSPVPRTEEAYVFFQQPNVISARNIFMMPFANFLWLTILITWVIIGVTMYLISDYKQHHQKFLHPGTSQLYSKYRFTNDKFFSLDTSLWIISIFCQQGWWCTPRVVPVRIVFIVGFVASVVIYSYYTAAYVAAISKPSVPIKEFTDFVQFGYTVFTDPNVPSFTLGFIKNEEVKEFREKSKTFFVNNDKAVKDVLETNSNLAFLRGADGFYILAHQTYKEKFVEKLCQITRMRAKHPVPLKNAMFFRKGSEYQEVFWVKTLALYELGLMRRYWNEYQVKVEPRCLDLPQQSPNLYMNDCFTAFVILLIGQLTAFILSLFETKKLACQKQ